ncbi:DUF418 domain-containing protein [Cellulomonas algicola]|uniref:DUF418 domain-containing protein n=1 Tax=Cellulomonas algicola TaxID=2071633 RepID=A0A401UZX3_9CELL|nr:DUF418 domain-containing protein [Cellulomonas algicola]GCD20226.1 hypothetical protein CTKZ_17880 [Cellulomonas algicola]
MGLPPPDPWAGPLGRCGGPSRAFGAHLSTTQAALLAVGVWLVTVAVAVALQRAGRRGPFEVALRRVAYGRA